MFGLQLPQGNVYINSRNKKNSVMIIDMRHPAELFEVGNYLFLQHKEAHTLFYIDKDRTFVLTREEWEEDKR